MSTTELVWSLCIILFLVALSGLFSGLTLGLLGLDKTGLEIVIGGGSEQEKVWAQKLLPLRADGNRLLCTLLVGNVVVNAWLSIFLANLYSSVTGLIASTTLIVIFGEILPQAACSRHALRVGATAVPLVRFFLLLLSPVAVPLGYLLDKLLGEDVGTVHTRTEILKYMEVHVDRGKLEKESGDVIRGALQMKSKSVVEVMTPLEDVYMLSDTTKLSFKAIREIFESGFSRVPVYRGERENIVGLLFVKDLIFVDPEDETEVTSLLSIFARSLVVVDETNALDDVLRIFKRGHGHLALVRAAQLSPRGKTRLTADPLSVAPSNDPVAARTPSSSSIPSTRETVSQPDQSARKSFFDHIIKKSSSTPQSNSAAVAESVSKDAEEVLNHLSSTTKLIDSDVITGIVTLEDIVEEIIGDEIIDETDVFVNVDEHIRVNGRSDFDFTRLRRLDARLVDERLSPEEIQAVTAHLFSNTQLTLSKEAMQSLVRRSRVVDVQRESKFHTTYDKVSPKDVVYAKGKPATFATLVLSGKLTVVAGKDMFRAEAGPWTVIGTDALLHESGSFVPDFSAYVATPTMRCLYISHEDYASVSLKTDDQASSSALSATGKNRLEYQKERRMGIKEKRRQQLAGVKSINRKGFGSQTSEQRINAAAALSDTESTRPRPSSAMYAESDSLRGRRTAYFSALSDTEIDANKEQSNWTSRPSLDLTQPSDLDDESDLESGNGSKQTPPKKF